MSPTNLSRRAILAGAASVPALAFPAVVAVAAPVSAAIQPIAGRNPDAEVFELVEQYIAAYAEHGRRIDEFALFEERLWAHHRAAEKEGAPRGFVGYASRPRARPTSTIFR
jgi:hypothetical protein